MCRGVSWTCRVMSLICHHAEGMSRCCRKHAADVSGCIVDVSRHVAYMSSC